jgi:hypothetical protein
VGNQEIKSGLRDRLHICGSGNPTGERSFDYFSEIKNSRLSLAIGFAEIKQIKEIKRRKGARSDCVCEFRQSN